MCVVEAIGGMGKSALCWKWLQDEIIATNEKVEGIVWWSFYDQGFEDFIHHLYEYCIPEHIRNRQQRIDETTEVISALTNHRFLLVLDGFERVLRGYAQMMAMYIQEGGLSQINMDAVNEAFDVVQRTPVTPKAEKLLRALCAGSSKTVMTTRLFPATIEGLAGVKQIKLTGLSKTDTIAFFKAEGIEGADEEMIKAGVVYGFHPLMLKLLSTAIKRSFTRNIERAFGGNLIIDEKEPIKILATSYNLLNKDEQKVAATISVFRTAFTFDAATALFPDWESEKLESTLVELCNLGFVMYNEQQRLFDFHPIMRSYLYNGLTGKDTVHQLAITYFSALPAKEKTTALADLEPVIEQYHHLVRAGRLDEACDLYYNRLDDQLFYQLALSDLCINLIQQLFTSPTEPIPELRSRGDQAYVLNHLGNFYALTGQLGSAKQHFGKVLLWSFEGSESDNLNVGLANTADMVHMQMAKLSAAFVHLTKVAAPAGNSRTFDEAFCNILLAYISIAAGCIGDLSEGISAESYLRASMTYAIDKSQLSIVSLVAFETTLLALAQVGSGENLEEEFCMQALSCSLEAAGSAEQSRIASYPVPLYFLRAYEAVCRALVAIMKFGPLAPTATGKVYFYDEHFQYITDAVIPGPDNYMGLAERCVNEGLTMSRKLTRVFNECTFSLLLAQMEWQKVRDGRAEEEHFAEVEKIISETHALAARIEYRMRLADVHLFCAEMLIEIQELKLGDKEQILGLSAAKHLEKAREYARDTSTIDDIFLPPDGSADEFYKDIPEYEMLKRGMTEEERITKGYYVAWLKAERLEARIV